MDYAKLIKEYREKYFLTQEDFATKLGVSFVTLNRWENGKYKPTMKMKKILHDLFLEAKLIKE